MIVADFRETRVYQEAWEEGYILGFQQVMEENKLRFATKLLRRGRSVAFVAEAAELSQYKVRKLKQHLAETAHG